MASDSCRSRAVTAHRRHEEAVHRALGGLEQVGRLGGVEATAAGRHRELLVEWHPEAEEALNGLAERQPERRGDAAVLDGRAQIGRAHV